jgi:anthranilate/para-aminobenzoate synthase component I
MGKDERFIWRIKLWRDLTAAKKELPLHIYIPYNTASYGVLTAIETSLKTLRVYNPHKENGVFISEQVCNTRAEAEEQKQKLEGFLFGKDTQIKKNETVRNALNQGGFRKAVKKLKNKITDGEQVLNLLNKFSIHLSWDIEEKHHNANV